MKLHLAMGGSNGTIDATTYEVDYDLPTPPPTSQMHVPWPLFAVLLACSGFGIFCALMLMCRFLVPSRSRALSRNLRIASLTCRESAASTGSDTRPGRDSDGEQDIADVDLERGARADGPRCLFLPSDEAEEKPEGEANVPWAAWLLEITTAALIASTCGTVVIPRSAPPTGLSSQEPGDRGGCSCKHHHRPSRSSTAEK
ncbi:hypothetical protein OH77DRAFT_1425395 [Trametes cingulata]|nr:hypothetical protein OH77DRAFT_1425395 [Trametes cingulata]